jgi:hypothetical protein
MTLIVTGPRNVHTFTCRKFPESYALHEPLDVIHMYIISPVRDYQHLMDGNDRRTTSKFTYFHLNKLPGSDGHH